MGDSNLSMSELMMLMGAVLSNKLTREMEINLSRLEVKNIVAAFDGIDATDVQWQELLDSDSTFKVKVISLNTGIPVTVLHTFLNNISFISDNTSELIQTLLTIVFNTGTPCTPYPSEDYIEPYKFSNDDDGACRIEIGNNVIGLDFLRAVLYKYDIIKSNNPEISDSELLLMVNDNLVE